MCVYYELLHSFHPTIMLILIALEWNKGGGSQHRNLLPECGTDRCGENTGKSGCHKK